MTLIPYSHSKTPSIAKNIRATLAVGLLVSCALIAVIGFTSWKNLNSLHNQIEDVVEESSVKTGLLYDMRIAARERNLHLMMILLRQDPFSIDEEWISFRNEGSKFLSYREAFIKIGIDEKEKSMLENQRELSKKAVVIQYQIYDYIMLEDREKALRSFNQHLDVQAKVFDTLDLLLDLQKIKNIHVVEKTKKSQDKGIKTIVILSLVVVFIIFITTVYIIRRLSQQAIYIENEGLKFKALIEGSMDAVLVLGLEEVTDCNANSFSMFEVSSLKEFNCIGFDYFSRFSEEKSADQSKGIFNAINHVLVESRRRYQWKFVDAKGKEFPADVELTGIELQGEHFVQMIIRDVTERERAQKALRDANENLELKVQERTEELKELNSKIAGVARSAGMAEVASGVLHNVGNVLNSVNVSTSVLREQVRNCKSDKLDKLVELLEENKEDLSNFIQNDEKGKFVIPYIKQLSNQLSSNQDKQVEELNGLSNNVDHIKNIITMQQTYTGGMGVEEKVKASLIFEDAIKINVASLMNHNIKLIREYGSDPELTVDKHKLMQVLVNLISNAKHAVQDLLEKEKKVVVGIEIKADKIEFYVEDNGIGIEKGDLSKLFEFGFKKRIGGHGYGLHHSALVSKEMKGRLSVDSDGLGQGAKFVLELPLE